MKTLNYVKPESIITGWDFSTGAVKCLAFTLDGNVLAESRFPTDLYYGTGENAGSIELNLMELEGQARATTRCISAQLRDLGRLQDWVGGGISATHHTAGRIDKYAGQVRRAICWNDQTLAPYHQLGMKRLGGEDAVQRLLGGPWAIRYTLSHLVKDEVKLSYADWLKTHRILTHGSLSAGYLTGNYDVISVSSAASTGLMNFQTRKIEPEMLKALENPEYRSMVLDQFPRIIPDYVPVGTLSESLCVECGLPEHVRPLIFPTSDDQQAGLVGGGAVNDGQLAIILGNSAVVNSSCNQIPKKSNLDVMALNWGPFLLMRCYSNGAYALDRVLGAHPDFTALETQARGVSPGCDGVSILPFIVSEPSLGVETPRLEWIGPEPTQGGIRFRACLEALAYLIALGVEEHICAGQKLDRISVSGGVARSELMCEILASVLGKPVVCLESQEGPALGAAVTALAALETHLRSVAGVTPGHDQDPFTTEDAVSHMVRFRQTVEPRAQWIPIYKEGLKQFRNRIK